MKFSFDDLCRLESTMRSASIGLRQVGVTKQVSDDLRSLEYVMSVLRSASHCDMSNPEDKDAALASVFDGLYR